MGEGCPSKELLRRIVTGAHSAEELERFAEHLETCDACRKAVDEMGGDISAPPQTSPDDESASAPPDNTVRMKAPGQTRPPLPQGILLDPPPATPSTSAVNGCPRQVGASHHDPYHLPAVRLQSEGS